MRHDIQLCMGDDKMKINVIAIGKIKEKYFADAIAEYVKRASRFADVKVTELPDAPQGKTPSDQQPATYDQREVCE
jgi:23S rRNA (pseudouridine1915-N3)-methyltransferase